MDTHRHHKNASALLTEWAEEPPLPEPSVPQKPKLALLMAAIDHVSNAGLWHAWLKLAKGRVTLLIHAAMANASERFQPASMRPFVVAHQAPTSWCDMHRAFMLLVGEALLDTAVTHLAAIDYSTLPAKPASVILSALGDDPTSRICSMTYSGNVAEAWWVLERRTAALFRRLAPVIEAFRGISINIVGLSRRIQALPPTKWSKEFTRFTARRPGWMDGGENGCSDEELWLAFAQIRSIRWGAREPLRDECTMFADWNQSSSWCTRASHWCELDERCGCPLFRAAHLRSMPSNCRREGARCTLVSTPHVRVRLYGVDRMHSKAIALRYPNGTKSTHPFQWEHVHAAALAQLQASPYWFARKVREAYMRHT